MAKKTSNIMDSTFKNLASNINALDEEIDDNLPVTKSHPNEGIAPKRKTIRLKVDPTLILPNEMNRYTMEDDEEYKELVESIKKDGVQNPLLCKKNDDGTYTLYSGHRRRKAALELGLDKVPIDIIIEQFTPSEECAYIARSNSGSRQKYPYDIARQINLYVHYLKEEQPNLSDNDLKKKAETLFTFSSRAFQNYYKLSTLPDEVLSWGAERLLTRDDGLYLVDILSNSEYSYFAEKAISNIRLIVNSESTTKAEEAKQEIKNIDVAIKRKKRNGPKKTNSVSLMRKISKLIAIDDYSIPKSKKQKEELMEMIEASREFLNQLEDELK